MERTVESKRRQVYGKNKKQKKTLGASEKRRFMQLGVCLVLFLSVLWARGTEHLEEFRGLFTTALEKDANFQLAYTDLNWSAASKQPLASTLAELWNDVFLPVEKPAPQTQSDGVLLQQTQSVLAHTPLISTEALAAEINLTFTDPMASSGSRMRPLEGTPPEADPVPEAESAPVEPEVTPVEYNGPALPENTSMDRYALHLEQTATPVMGRVSSGFGWREHPIDGEEKFHNGVDLAVGVGTPVLAFADGTVDYIGESDIYGRYLQIAHANGVTSFYAHCNRLCVQKGQVVTVGEKVAESGETGYVTGPHLHFELKKDGVRLQPLYYIDATS